MARTKLTARKTRSADTSRKRPASDPPSEILPPECSVCLLRMAPPVITVCELGHSVCGTCLSQRRLELCAICRGSLLSQSVRCRELETVCEQITPTLDCSNCGEERVPLRQAGARHCQVCPMPECDSRYCLSPNQHLVDAHQAIHWRLAEHSGRLALSDLVRESSSSDVRKRIYHSCSGYVNLNMDFTKYAKIRPLLVTMDGEACVMLLLAMHKKYLMGYAALMYDPDPTADPTLRSTRKLKLVLDNPGCTTFHDKWPSVTSEISFTLPILTKYEPMRFSYLHYFAHAPEDSNGNSLHLASAYLRSIMVV